MDFKQKGKFPWLTKLMYSIEHRGLSNTCFLGWKEWRKERQLGINTFGDSAADELSIESDSKLGGHLYQPSSSVIFERAMNELPFNFGDKVFLDVGSGKGRAMILAAEAGFKKVIGVEYAAELNDIAHTNIEVVKPRFPKTEFELSEGDALEYKMSKEVDVIYLFNPFDEETICKLLEQLKLIFKRNKKIYLVYVHPVHSASCEEVFGKPVSTITNRKGISDVVIFCN